MAVSQSAGGPSGLGGTDKSVCATKAEENQLQPEVLPQFEHL